MNNKDVTEKVAQALWERYGTWPNGPLAAWLTRSDCDRLAREALAALSDPEVLAGMAGVLREHSESKGDASFLPSCRCGWVGASRMAWVADLARHQATALADWLRGTDDPDTPVTVYDEEEA